MTLCREIESMRTTAKRATVYLDSHLTQGPEAQSGRDGSVCVGPDQRRCAHEPP